ncbi:MAG: methylmalonyl-CoA epimerase [Bacteroidota bacterium]|jgi:methylmalonyl-CoA/ethylmalonyl-CoA epimerase
MDKIEHIGIAVKDLKTAGETYTKILGMPPYKTETVESEGVNTMFFQIGESKIELLESIHAESPISKFIDKKGEGIHHIAFGVSDIKAEMKRLEEEGFTLLNAEPKLGADNKWVCFLHPKGSHGVLIELCQDR